MPRVLFLVLLRTQMNVTSFPSTKTQQDMMILHDSESPTAAVSTKRTALDPAASSHIYITTIRLHDYISIYQDHTLPMFAQNVTLHVDERRQCISMFARNVTSY